jgi:hypothetical protein
LNFPQYVPHTPSPEIEELGEAPGYDIGMHSHHGSPDPPQEEPHVHPGPGWSLNHDGTRVLYNVRLPIRQEGLEVLAFIWYDFDTNDPKLLLTRGRGCTVHSQPLHAQPCPRPYPATAPTHHEQVFFHQQERHTPLVNRALELEDDITLRAEVQCYRGLND